MPVEGCVLCAAAWDVRAGKVGADFVAATFFVEGYLRASVHTCPDHLAMLERCKEQAIAARRGGEQWETHQAKGMWCVCGHSAAMHSAVRMICCERGCDCQALPPTGIRFG